MSTRTIPAAEIERHHLGLPVSLEAPTTEGPEHVEGSLAWFTHYDGRAGMVTLGVQDARTGIVEDWQVSLETVITTRVPEGGAPDA
jgi:hypothetical protein